MYVYAILGGTPAYLLQFNPIKNLWDNIREKILTPEAYLFSEPEFILREELREPRNYFAILRAMSLGKTRPGEIINETGFEKNVVGKYLSVLADLRIIKREVPVTEKSFEKTKKGIYAIDDNFFRFWFCFVFPNKSFIHEGEIDYLIDKKMVPRLDLFTSAVFEEVCRCFLRSKSLPDGMRFNKTGRWWSRDAEIDILAINEEDNAILFGEAKWSTKKVGADILRDLKEKTARVEWGGPGRKEYFALFSRKGFTAELKKIAEQEGILLKTIEEL